MASGRTYHVRYGNRSTYQAKIRPEVSPAEELFDRLVGTSSRESPTKRVSASTSDRSNRKGKRDETVKEPSSESPLQTKGKTTSYSKATYSYSPRRCVHGQPVQYIDYTCTYKYVFMYVYIHVHVHVHVCCVHNSLLGWEHYA